MRRRSGREEKGFTLVELLIVTSVMPIIVGAITAGLFTVITLQSSTTGRIGDSGNAQIVQSTFIKDVQSATFITTEATTTPQCGGSPSNTQLLGLQWGNSLTDIANGNSSNPSTVVSYDIVPITVGSTTTYSLVREYCTLGNFSTPTTSTTVSDDVAAAGTQPPPCYSGAGCNPYDTSHNPPIAWTASSAVPLVKFEITELKSGYQFTLSANSLASTPPGAGGTVAPPFSPLTLLNTASGAGSSLSMQAGSVLNITGTGTAGTTMAVTSTYDSSVSIPGDAALSASSIFTEDPNLASLTGAGLGFLTPEYYDSSIPDPMAAMITAGIITAPPATSEWPLNSTSCSNPSGSIYNCPAGLYNSDPNFPSGSTVTFTGFGGGGGYGNYEFASTFKIPTNSTITFNKGEYVFDGSPAITPDVVQTQTLTWTSLITSPVVGTTYPLAATANPSGLTPSYSLASGSTGCSLVAGGVKITANGLCLVNANQAGNATYGPADQIQQVIPIPSSKTAQAIAFTSTQPTSESINATYTPTATAPGGTVTFTPSGPCSINGGTGVVTFTGAGTCDINANQAGNSTYRQAPEAQQAIVVIAGTGVTTITGNSVLFYVPPTGGSVNFGGSTSVELTPLGSGLAIWDASSNAATTVTITNVATSRNTYGGIYIPEGTVNVTSNSYTGGLSVMFIVAQTLNMAQQLTLNVTGP